MVYYHSSISVCDSADLPPLMADQTNSPSAGAKSRNKKLPSSQNCLKSNNCHGSQSAAIDVVILIAVVFASGFLLFPYIKFLTLESIEIAEAVLYAIADEISEAPLIYGSLGLSVLFSAIAGVGFLLCSSNKCGKRNCRGLRKATEFDIQLETEECVRSSNQVKNGVKKQPFEFPSDRRRELEAELKKIAPLNGRAVLIFRGRCGCSMGRLEVAGPKKIQKMKNAATLPEGEPDRMAAVVLPIKAVPSSNGVLKRQSHHFLHHFSSAADSAVVSYNECLKNHATSLGLATMNV